MRQSKIILIFAVLLQISKSNAENYPDPINGWDYQFTGNLAENIANAALDGTWDHNNNSDQWDGTTPDSGNPGGITIVPIKNEPGNTALLMVDAVTSSGRNNNRRLALTHNLLIQEGIQPNFLKLGATIAFRIKVPHSSPYLIDSPNGLAPHANAKGIINLRGSGGRISFSLGIKGTDAFFPDDGFFVSDSNNPIFHNLDPTAWNEFWITIQESKNNNELYELRAYKNGSIAPFISRAIGLSRGTEESFPYISLQLSSTTETAAVEIDYLAFKSGVHAPDDNDEDGIPDSWELNYFNNILLDQSSDPDDDGLTNLEEFNLGTDPTSEDSDGDGINDNIEHIVHLTDPANPDTDQDGLSDAEEINGQPATDPLLSDSDGDGINDREELLRYNTNPNDRDTDQDGANDRYELEKGYDPTDPGEVPVFPSLEHLLINEFMATGGSSLTDLNSDRPDWIEIWNPTNETISLQGYYLTDDKSQLDKWAFTQQTIKANKHLVIFASGKDRTDPRYEQHTNFSLDSDGEYLALTRMDSNGSFEIISEFASKFPTQEQGISYGLDPETLNEGYLEMATPKQRNEGGIALGFVKDTKFSVDRGFFTEPFMLQISSETTGATIRYTTNGSEPTALVGKIYKGPIQVSKTTMIRAAAFKENYFATNIDTHTYLFLNDIYNQQTAIDWPSSGVNGQVLNYGMDPDIISRYTPEEMIDALSAIPSISIVTKQTNLTSSSGIYVNAQQHGSNWERPASFEIIDPKKIKSDIQINCGIRIRGGFSRQPSNPKHSFRLFFRDSYGGELNYPLFDAEGVDTFSKLDLRTSQNYSWAFGGSGGNNTFLRELLGRDLQGSTGQPYTKSRYYHLYLNGIYWGLFMTHERAEANFGESYFGGNEKDYDTIKSAGSIGGYNTEATDGSISDGSAWHTLWTMAQDLSRAPSIDRFMRMQGLDPDGSRNPEIPIYLDVNNLIDYSMIIGYTGNTDAPPGNNNWYGIRNRVSNDLGFQFFVHDGEHSLGAYGATRDTINRDRGAGRPYNKSNPAYIRYYIEESSPEFRLRFADRAHQYLFNDGPLTTSRVLAKLQHRKETVSKVIITESARWGDSARSDPYDKEDWENAVRRLENEIPGRRNIFLAHLRQGRLYPKIAAPEYVQHGGQIAMDSTIGVWAPIEATHLYYVIGEKDSDPDDWTDELDPRQLGGTPSLRSKSLLINETVLAPENASKRAIMPEGPELDNVWFLTEFDDSLWPTGKTGAGYDKGSGYNEFIDPAFNFRDQVIPSEMETVFMRINFEIDDPSQHNTLTLKARYDDGFVAYLNGHEIIRKNAPGTVGLPLPFNSKATTGHKDNLAKKLQSFTIPEGSFSLNKGTNLLAIQGLNDLKGSSDMLLSASLVSNKGQNEDTVYINIPEPISSPTWIKSRSYNSRTGEWSALNSAFFTTGKSANDQNIVISEVHYHPSAPTESELEINPDFDQDDFEFIEVMNVSGQAIDLGGCAFVLIPVKNRLEGVEFKFEPTTIIKSNERLVIVANRLAFETRYPGIEIAGDYSNRLDNSGEWITLIDKGGTIIDSFRYNDKSPWPELADGEGPSLYLPDPSKLLDTSNAENWSASMTGGGNPTSANAINFFGNPTADADEDGTIAIMEYALGLSDFIPSSDQFPKVKIINIEGQNYLNFTFRKNPETTSISYHIETSTDMKSWEDSNNDGSVHFEGESLDSDGTSIHTFRLKTPINHENSMRYLRLKINY